jgi:hypothetical protein
MQTLLEARHRYSLTRQDFLGKAEMVSSASLLGPLIRGLRRGISTGGAQVPQGQGWQENRNRSEVTWTHYPSVLNLQKFGLRLANAARTHKGVLAILSDTVGKTQLSLNLRVQSKETDGYGSP